MKPAPRRFYAVARWIFFLASIAFLATFAHRTMMASGHPLWPLLRGALGETALSSVFFLFAALATVPAWRALLRALGATHLPVGATVRIFCLTQIAKYLPGNIGHHVGRVALARTNLGIPATTTTISILQEGALVVAAAVLVGCVGVLVPSARNPSIGIDLDTLLVGTLLAGFGALLLVNRFRAILAGPDAHSWRALLLRAAPTWRGVSGALPWHLLVHVLNGAAVACIASAMVPVDLADIALLTRAYALSWMLGFLLPGAPGGLGVRESAFVLLAGTTWPPDAVLAMATLSRIGNIIADMLIFLGGAAMATRGPGTSPVIERKQPE